MPSLLWRGFNWRHISGHQGGQVALGFQWYYYFKELGPETSATKYKLGFAALPGRKGAGGKVRRFVMAGGQGVSISEYSRHKEEAWKFLEWLTTNQQQWKWVEGGRHDGFGCHSQGPEVSGFVPGPMAAWIGWPTIAPESMDAGVDWSDSLADNSLIIGVIVAGTITILVQRGSE